MHQPDDMLRDVKLTDPAVEAALTALTLAEEMAALIRAETEMLQGETRQILTYNQALMETVLSPVKEAQAAIALAKRWRI